jgi:hypothetical protein
MGEVVSSFYRQKGGKGLVNVLASHFGNGVILGFLSTSDARHPYAGVCHVAFWVGTQWSRL